MHEIQSDPLKPKRHRNDRLIGFRLDPSDYATLTRLLADEAISISAYMRRLVQSDAQRTTHRGTHAPQ